MNQAFDPVPAALCGVPFFSDAHLERIVLDRLRQYEQVIQQQAEPPIDIDTIVEVVERIQIVMIEPSHELPDDALGAYDFLEDLLYLREDCGSEARRRFTLAHEYGHFVLHRPHFLRPVYDYYSSPRTSNRQVLGQEPSRRSRLEYQANLFAGQLLMPTGYLSRFLQSHHEADGDVIAAVAKAFHVSRQAACIRLEGMKA